MYVIPTEHASRNHLQIYIKKIEIAALLGIFYSCRRCL